MKNFKIFKPLALAIPLVLVGCNQSLVPPKPVVPCDVGNTNGFTVTLSVEDDGTGNPEINFTNYNLNVAPNGGKARSPLIFICLGGQATFDGVPSIDRVTIKNRPGGVFSPGGNPNNKTKYILKNNNSKKGKFRYAITVNTKDFGIMVIDPRIENNGGGTN